MTKSKNRIDEHIKVREDNELTSCYLAFPVYSVPSLEAATLVTESFFIKDRTLSSKTGHCQQREQQIQPMYYVRAFNDIARAIKFSSILMSENEKY